VPLSALKKLISICFLLIIMVSQYGHYVIYTLQDIQIEHEFKSRFLAGIPDSSLEIIQDNKDIRWKEEGKEFFLDGEMYDVVKTKLVDGKKQYAVLKDRVEKQLEHDFGNIMKSNNENSSANKHALKFQAGIFIIPGAPEILLSFKNLKPSCFSGKYALLTHPKTVIPTPPWAVI